MNSPLRDPRVEFFLEVANAYFKELGVHFYATLAARITLELPALMTKEGKPMPNYELPSDSVATITIKTVNSGGTTEPVPAGDVFTVASSLPASLGAAIGVDAAGNPAIVLTPLVVASPGISITITDSSGLPASVLIVDVVDDVKDANIVPDVADAVLTSQPTPAAPGP